MIGLVSCEGVFDRNALDRIIRLWIKLAELLENTVVVQSSQP